VQELDTIDTRLLRLFEAIHTTRNVTRAGEQLALSQPTISIGLRKLRVHFGDALFVRTADGMQPTPQAEALIEPIREVLQSLREISQSKSKFNPGSADRKFSICMTDASHITLLPQLLAYIRRVAPGVRLEAANIDAGMPHALQSGEADLALGLIPTLEAGFYQQTLYRQDWVCLTSRKHPRVKRTLTLDAYRREAHISIVSGTGQQLLEDALSRCKIEQRVVLRLPGFLGLTAILESGDLVATLPRHIGETLAKLGGLTVLECPFAIKTFSVKQHWHARYHNDPANRWLRSVCAKLFTA
jgi:DNA-binding transcriptional LysR family regulator